MYSPQSGVLTVATQANREDPRPCLEAEIQVNRTVPKQPPDENSGGANEEGLRIPILVSKHNSRTKSCESSDQISHVYTVLEKR